jgi:hypothetical protein
MADHYSARAEDWSGLLQEHDRWVATTTSRSITPTGIARRVDVRPRRCSPGSRRRASRRRTFGVPSSPLASPWRRGVGEVPQAGRVRAAAAPASRRAPAGSVPIHGGDLATTRRARAEQPALPAHPETSSRRVPASFDPRSDAAVGSPTPRTRREAATTRGRRPRCGPWACGRATGTCS